MNGRPPNDHFRQFLVGLGIAVILVSLPTIAVQQYDANQSQNNHHAASVRQENEIIVLIKEVKEAQADGHSTLAEVKAVENTVATVIKGLPAADAELADFAVWIEGCLSTGDCSNPPKL
jgi:CRISPR/Cas system-associated protein endoribonuclease Cas2